MQSLAELALGVRGALRKPDFSKASGISTTSIYKLEHGLQVHPETIEKLATYAGPALGALIREAAKRENAVFDLGAPRRAVRSRVPVRSLEEQPATPSQGGDVSHLAGDEQIVIGCLREIEAKGRMDLREELIQYAVRLRTQAQASTSGKATG